jgi:homogentisate 1,2-dioxygenase
MAELRYQSGFLNEFATEAEPGALPIGQNAPQKHPLGLYAEQFSGTAFTMPRGQNRRSWLYRIRPSTVHKPYTPVRVQRLIRGWPCPDAVTTPNQLRWDPEPIPPGAVDFVDGMMTLGGNGDSSVQSGGAIHIYVATRSMQKRFFWNADGEFLLVPQQGRLLIFTEMGKIEVAPGEICVLPRGLKYRVELLENAARGYICENYGQQLRLPDLGPIGANGLANPRDFLTPVAAYEDLQEHVEVIAKYGGSLWCSGMEHSPLNVVGWHGNYAPYKYDLARFNTINTVSFDHPDPSIFTVLTAPSEIHGTSNIDFVIFPPRWMVAENTFRPPWFHRNVMNEFMGLIFGQYDAKAEGFLPGGCSLHNCMSGHGPDAETYERATNAELKPVRLENTLAFMFEMRFVVQTTKHALESRTLQRGYFECWQGLNRRFTPPGRQ